MSKNEYNKNLFKYNEKILNMENNYNRILKEISLKDHKLSDKNSKINDLENQIMLLNNDKNQIITQKQDEIKLKNEN